MLRKDIIQILLNNPMTVSSLARQLGLKPREIESDLHHLFISSRHTPYVPVVEPATCKKCAFVFSEETLSKPSKCPECKGSWIADPRISFVEKAGAQPRD